MIKRIKVLRFTDEKGNTAILGINENNLPVIKFVYNEKVDSGVILEQGEIKNGNQPSSGEGIQYGKIDPNAPKPKDFEKMM